MRKKIIAANWKMHAPPPGWDAEDSPYASQNGVEVIVFPTLLDIHTCVEHFLTTGGQCGRSEEAGAFTGDVSMQLLANHGCTYVLCGHSERRQHHAENDEMIAKQVEAALKAGLRPILCIGETADERELGQEKEVITRQLSFISRSPFSDLSGVALAESDLRSLLIAYEPVWAIGNGKTASPTDVQEMHAFIRSILPESIRDSIHILYGGSVKPDTAAALFTKQDIDGALVGAASLDAHAFRAIVHAA